MHLHVTQVVRDDGAILPCALNATCAALVDAGILLRSMFGKPCAAIAQLHWCQLVMSITCYLLMQLR